MKGPTALFKVLERKTEAAANIPKPMVCCGCSGGFVSLLCHLGSGTDPGLSHIPAGDLWLLTAQGELLCTPFLFQERSSEPSNKHTSQLLCVLPAL